MPLTAAKSATSDDLFRCQLFLYDYDAWFDLFHEEYTWANDRNFRKEVEAAEARQIEVIHYFEKLGMSIEPPDFYETEGRMFELIDSGQWTRMGPA